MQNGAIFVSVGRLYDLSRAKGQTKKIDSLLVKTLCKDITVTKQQEENNNDKYGHRQLRRFTVRNNAADRIADDTDGVALIVKTRGRQNAREAAQNAQAAINRAHSV